LAMLWAIECRAAVLHLYFSIGWENYVNGSAASSKQI